MVKKKERLWKGQRPLPPQRQARQGDDPGSDFTLAELEPGEVAFCLKRGNTLYIIEEHLTAEAGLKMLRDVLTGVISPEALSAKEWREVNIHEVRFKSVERMELPPLKDWPSMGGE